MAYSFQATWVRYKHAAGPYTAFFFTTLVLSVIISGIIGGVFSALSGALVALLTSVFAQMLGVGWAHFARAHYHGQDGTFDYFFRGFTQNARQVVAFGLLVGALSYGISSLMPAAFFDVLAQADGETAPQTAEEFFMWVDDLTAVFNAHRSKFAAIGALSLVLNWLTLFAPYRISLGGDTLLAALNWSATKALTNAPQLLAVYLTFSILSAIALPLTLFLAMVIVVPYSQLLAYDMYTQLLEEEDPIASDEF